MNFSILINAHFMLGVDIHQGTPGPPVVPVPMPHFVAQVLGGLNLTAKTVPSVLSHNLLVLNQGSDIGPGIGHVAANILFPLYVLTSASVSHFGSFSVLSENKPTAAAIFVYANQNLNCNWPLNLPTGVVVAPNTDMVGMQWADVGASLTGMAVDMAVSGITGLMFGGICNGAIKGLTKYVSKVPASKLAEMSVLFSSEYGKGVVGESFGAAMGSFFNTPTGDLSSFISNEINERIIPGYSKGVILND